LHIGQTFGFHLFRHGRVGEDEGNLCGQPVRIVRVHIDTGRASGLFQAGTGGRNDGDSRMDGLDDGDAEPLETGGIDEKGGTLVEGRQLAQRNAVQQSDAFLQPMGAEVGFHFLRIGRMPSDGYQAYVVGQAAKGTGHEQQVLALLDAAHIQDVRSGQSVFVPHLFL